MTTMIEPATMRDAFYGAVADAVEETDDVALVLADISAAEVTGLAARHPDRVINVGIREQLLVSVAGGLALAGMRPVVHTYAPFLVERPFEQIKLDFAHQGVDGVLVSIGGSYDAASAGRTHQSPGDVALIDTLPGWAVHVPGHPEEADRLLRETLAGTGSHYVRLSTETNTDAHPGEGLQVLRTGSDGVVVAVGPTLDATLAATAGLDVAVAYTSTVRPFDAAGLRAVLDSAGGTDVVLVEPYLAGTSSHVVAEALADRPHRQLGLGVGRGELRRYGTPADHEAAHGLDAASLRAACEHFLVP